MKTLLRITLSMFFCIALCLSISILAFANEIQVPNSVYYNAQGAASYRLAASPVTVYRVTLDANGGYLPRIRI